MQKEHVKAAPTSMRETPAGLRLGTLGEFVTCNGSRFCEGDIIPATSGVPFAALCASDKCTHGVVGDVMSAGTAFVYSGTPQLT